MATTTTNKTESIKTEPETVKKLDELKFTAKAYMDSFYDPDKNESREYIAISMPNFVDPEDGDVLLGFNSDKDRDENGKTKKNKVKTLFKYDAKKFLKTAEKVDLPGVIRYKSWFIKKENRYVNFISIVIFNPFDEGAAINMYIKQEEQAAVIERYVKKNFNLHIEEGASLSTK